MSMTLAQIAELRLAIQHTVGGIETPRLIIAALDELAAIKAAPEPATVAVDAVALEALRNRLEVFDLAKLDPGLSFFTARSEVIEAARRLLEGGE